MPRTTRELLSAYFDTCRRLIDRYGGTVEKFIGDAVMAVSGDADRERGRRRARRPRRPSTSSPPSRSWIPPSRLAPAS